MPAITSLEVDSFRCFKKLQVTGLTPITLFVGANNAGKTALLEAIEAVTSEESPFLLYRASVERWEYRKRQDGDQGIELDPRHWFYGHKIEESPSFAIRAQGDRDRSLLRSVRRVPADSVPPYTPGGFMLTIERPSGRQGLPSMPLTADGFLGAPSPSRFVEYGRRLNPPVGFVTTDRLFPTELQRIWGEVVLTPNEDRTVAALQLVQRHRGEQNTLSS
jgi:AAA ATPase domain